MGSFAEEFYNKIKGLDKEEAVKEIEGLMEDVYSDGHAQGISDAAECADIPNISNAELEQHNEG